STRRRPRSHRCLQIGIPSLQKGGICTTRQKNLRKNPRNPPLVAQRVGNGHAARSEICNRPSSGTQQRCAISSAIALADCTWLLDIGDRRTLLSGSFEGKKQ